MRLSERMSKLEDRIIPAGNKIAVLRMNEGQGETEEEAISRYEVENGPIYDPRGDVIRVVIRRFGEAA